MLLFTRDTLTLLGYKRMDVYLNSRRDLLVVKKGCPIPPIAALGSWRKSKKRVVKVSEEIRSAVHAHGYYMRKLRDRHQAKSRMGISRRFQQIKRRSALCSAW